MSAGAQAVYTDGTEEGAASAKDELTHAAYWQFIGFEDPTPPEKQREFALCGAQCGSDLHDEDADEGKPTARIAIIVSHTMRHCKRVYQVIGALPGLSCFSEARCGRILSLLPHKKIH